jgi:diguanylate cyclase (GGDEF)-like protein
MMLDLDGFKEVNDTFGHLRGDELLRQVGEALLDTARPGDLVCRYAGDEFVLLLPDAVPEHVARVVERVRQAVEALPPVEGQVRIRVSLGAASYPEDGEDARSLLHAADQRMYEDKFRRRQGADGELPGLPEPEPSLA